MDKRERLIQFLRESKAQLIWAVERLRAEWQTALPPNALGEWSAQRILAHVREVEQRYYEWNRQMASGAQPKIAPIVWAEQPWDPAEPVAAILSDFVSARDAHVNFLASLDEASWRGTGTRAVWGEVTVEWLATKGLQHTLDHLNHLVRMGIFWEIRAREDAP